MKILTLTDGTQLQVSDFSSFGDIVMVFSSREQAGAFWNHLTKKSLKEAKLNDEEFSAVPQSMNAILDKSNRNITVHYINSVISPIPVYPEIEDPELL